MPDIFVGRQPIYDRQLQVFAYELLFRSGDDNQAGFLDGDQATSQVILNTFMDIGIDPIVGSKLAFINMTRDFFLLDYTQIFPPDRVVMEILEHIEVDTEFIEAVRLLSSRGYTIALDDFVYRESLHDLLELADIIKVDVLALDRTELQEHVPFLRQYGAKLLAEKVETQDDFRFCKSLGFDYLQGYFLCKPEIIKGQRAPANRPLVLQLLAKLQNPEVDFKELEEIVRRDVGLSYKLLRVINSAYYSLPKKVDSLREALLLLGTAFITSWLRIIILAEIDDKPHDLVLTAMIRAKMCELLGKALSQQSTETFFTVGLFSALEALLDSPIEVIMESLPLSDDITSALVSHEGLPGETLHCVLAYERSNWDEVHCQSLDHGRITDAYLEAIAWASQTDNQLVK
jgi:EAL and modified HD-GYP domain-containing signal transduction protein